MIYIALFGGIFLGWAFGRNNLSNVFGSAIGTRMVSLRTGATLAGIFILLGALISGTATTNSIMQLGHVSGFSDALIVSVCIGFVMFSAGRFGIPVSIVQACVGCLIGLNFFNEAVTDWDLVMTMIKGWIISPIIALVLTFILFKCVRFVFYKISIPLLYRDMWVRILLIFAGICSAYALGANNISTLVGPYKEVGVFPPYFLICVIGLSVAIGAQMADKRVIETVSTGLFPLSPLEALVVILSGALTLLCFSSVTLANLLAQIHIPTILVPIPTSCILVGSIVGISCAKGGRGIQFSSLSKLLASWFIIPLFSGLICFTFMGILKTWGWI